MQLGFRSRGNQSVGHRSKVDCEYDHMEVPGT